MVNLRTFCFEQFSFEYDALLKYFCWQKYLGLNFLQQFFNARENHMKAPIHHLKTSRLICSASSFHLGWTQRGCDNVLSWSEFMFFLCLVVTSVPRNINIKSLETHKHQSKFFHNKHENTRTTPMTFFQTFCWL